MKILVTGASGFIGAKIVTDLLKAGHDVSCCVRNTIYTKKLFPHAKIIDCDFKKDIHVSDWSERLQNIDVVINTVGIFYHPKKEVIWRTHYDTPKALFAACEQSKVKKIIHLSALGVDKYNNEYAKSKKAIEEYLVGLPVPSIILRPSLVYGRGSYGGMSLFRGLAGLPKIIPVPNKGEQTFQPIFLPDLSKIISNCVEQEIKGCIILAAVSEEKISLKNLLSTLRNWMGLTKPWFFNMPNMILNLVATLGDYFPYSTINSDAKQMLAQNNVATKSETEQFLKFAGIELLPFARGVFDSPSTVQDRWHARLYFIKPLLKITLGIIWLFAGLTSAFFSPKEHSWHLLTQAGIPEIWQPFALYLASFWDMIIGIALLTSFRIKLVCLLQALTILVYTAIITVKIPGLWLDPFGSIIKNISVLISIYILYVMESER